MSVTNDAFSTRKHVICESKSSHFRFANDADATTGCAFFVSRTCFFGKENDSVAIFGRFLFAVIKYNRNFANANST